MGNFGWLEDLPVVGDAFGVVQSAVDKVKGALDKIPFDKIKVAWVALAQGRKQRFSAADRNGDLFDNQTGRMSGLLNSQGKCSATRN